MKLYGSSEDQVMHLKTIKANKCRYCTHEDDRKCTVKPGKKSVKLNKKRSKCKLYERDEDRLNAALAKRVPMPVHQRPDWYWLTNNERKRYWKILQGLLSSQQGQDAAPGYEQLDSGLIVPRSTVNTEHPITGNLDRFKGGDK